MADNEKTLGIKLVADVTNIDKQVDKIKKDAEKQPVEIPVSLDAETIVKSLHSIQGAVSKVSDAIGKAFDKDLSFSKFQKSLDEVNKKIVEVTKTFNKGTPKEFKAIKVDMVGLNKVLEAANDIRDVVTDLNSSKIDIGVFEKLEAVLLRIEDITNSIKIGLNFETIRPSKQVMVDIERTTKELEELQAAGKAFDKLEKNIRNKTMRLATQSFFMDGYGSVGDIDNFEKVLENMRDYMKLGGDLSKVTFKTDTGMKSLQDLFDGLSKLGAINPDTFLIGSKLKDDFSGTYQQISNARSEIKLLNEELEKSLLRENRDLNVSLDTKSVEEFSAAILAAVQSIGQLNISIPDNFSFEGLSTESLDKIIIKLDEVVSTLKEINGLLTSNIDFSQISEGIEKQASKEKVEINIEPAIDAKEFTGEIERQLSSSGKDNFVSVSVQPLVESVDEFIASIEKQLDIAGGKVNVNIGTDALAPDTETVDKSAFQNFQDHINDIKEGLDEISSDFGYSMTENAQDFTDTLRKELLDIVKQFQNSLKQVSIFDKPNNAIYDTIRQWAEASEVLLKSGEKDVERSIFLNRESGAVSNTHLSDKEGSFSGKLIDALNTVSAGVSGSISELYDTWLHSHPLKKAEQGLKALGADIGFSVEDLEIFKKRFVKQQLANMMVTSNGKFANFDFSDLTEEILQQVIENFKNSDVFKGGKFRSSLVTEGNKYNFDKQSEILNSEIISAMTKAGVKDASSRFTTGDISELQVDLSSLQKEQSEVINDSKELLNILNNISTTLVTLNGSLSSLDFKELDSVKQSTNEILEAMKNLREKLNLFVADNMIIIDVRLNTENFDWDLREVQEKIQDLSKDVVINIKGLLDETTFGFKMNRTDDKSQRERDIKDLNYIIDVAKKFPVLFEEFKIEGSDLFNELFKHHIESLGFELDKLTTALKNTGFADEQLNPTFSRVTSGSQHSDEFGVIGQKYVMIGRDSRQPATLASSKIKQEKIDELADMGVNIARIVLLRAQNEVYSKDTSDFIEVQERKPGKNHREVYDEFVNMSKEQMVDLLRDMKAIFEKDLSVELCGDNLLFDKNTGVTTPIDILTHDMYPWMDVKDLNSFVDSLSNEIERDTGNWDFRSRLEEALEQVNNEEFIRKPIEKELNSLDIDLNPITKDFLSKIQATIINEPPVLVEVAPKLVDDFIDSIQKELNNKQSNDFIDPMTGELYQSREELLKSIPSLENFANLDIDKYADLIRNIRDLAAEGDFEDMWGFWSGESSRLQEIKTEINSLIDSAPELREIFGWIEIDDVTKFYNNNEDIFKLPQSAAEEVKRLVDEYLKGLEQLSKAATLPTIEVKPVVDVDSFEKEIQTALQDKVVNINVASREETVLDQGTVSFDESSEMDKVATATEEAVQAKKDFTTANEDVQDSVDGSKSKLQLEAELMESIAKSAREAAEAKKEFVEANELVKKSAKESNKETKKDENIPDTYEKNINKAWNMALKENAIFDNNTGKNFLQGFETKLDFLKENDSNKTEEYQKQLDTLYLKLADLKKLVPIDFTDDVERTQLESLKLEIQKIVSDLDNTKKYTLAAQMDIDKLMGKISDTLNKNSAMPKDLKQEFITLREQLERTGLSALEIEKIRESFVSLDAQMKRTGKTGISLADRIKKKFTDVAAYFATYVSIQDFIQMLRRGFETIKEYDTALTEMRKVSNETVESLKEYQKATFDVANTVGTTATALQKSTADFLRIGEAMEDAALSAQTATVLFNVSEFESIDKATDSLISMSSAYKELGKGEIVDVVNQLGNNFAISTDGLATALQNSASALKTAQNDFFESAALVTAANTVTQDPDKVGAGLRTIALRLTGTEAAREELAEMGEDVDDFIVTTTSKLDQKIKDLTKTQDQLGVSLLDMNGNYRSTYEVLLDIAKVWDTIAEEDLVTGENRQNALLEMMAGKNRANILASVLQSPQVLEDAYASALTADGSAQKELDKYLDSVNGKIAKFQNQLEKLTTSSIDSEAVKGVIDLGTSLLSILTKIIDKVGTLNLLGGIGGAILGAKNSGIIKQETIASWFSGVSTSIENDVIQPFANAEQVIWKYNQAIEHNCLTQKGWERLLAQCDDSLKNYLVGIKGSTASLAGYNISLQGNVTGFKKVTAAIAQYNALSTSGVAEQNAFATAISATNARLGGYLIGLRGARAGMGGYVASLVGATIKTVALQVATIALNAAITMGASLIISGIVSAISDWINKTENIIKASDEALEKVKELNNELKNNQKTVSETARRYAELAQGVDQLTGKNLTLNSDEYEEFLSLSGQLAEIFPTLSRNYDDNGNAIVQLTGDIDGIVGSLNSLIETQRELANIQIAEELPTIFDGLVVKSTEYEQELLELKNKREALLQGYSDIDEDALNDKFLTGLNDRYLEVVSNDVEEYARLVEDYTKILDEAKLDFTLENYEAQWTDERDEYGQPVLSYKTAIHIDSSDEDVEEAKKVIASKTNTLAAEYSRGLSELEGKIKAAEAKNKSNWNSLSSSVHAWLSTDDSFKIMDDTVQAAVQNMVNNLDWAGLDFSSWKDAEEYIQEELLTPIVNGGDKVSEAINNLFSVDFSNLSAAEAKQIVDKYVAEIASLLDKDVVELKVMLGLEDYDAVAENYEKMLNKVAKTVSGATDGEIVNGRGKAGEYHEIYKKIDDFGKKYAINTQDEIAAFDKAIDEAEGDIEKAFQIYLNDKAEREQLIITKESLDSVKTYRDELGKLYESLALLRSGEASPTDLYSLIEEFPELSKYVEDLKQGLDLEPSEAVNYVEALQGQIRNLIDIRFDSLKEKFGDIVGEDVLRSLAKYSVKTEAVNSAFDATAEAINNTSEAFQTLSESVKYYNEHGYITLDMLENIVKMEPKKLAMLMEENELIKENTDAYKQYLKLQLQSYKYDITEEAQKEHKRLEEAYRNGEISWAERQAGWADTTEAWRIKYNAVTDTWDAIESGEYLPGSSEASSTESVLDWVEIKIKSITEEIEKLKEVADDPFASWDERSSNLKAALDRMKTLREDYTKAAQIYLDKANSVGLDSTYVGKIQSGAWDIDDVPEDITQDTYELIQEYQTWWDKYQEMLNSERDATQEINDLTRNSFDQIISRFDAELSHFENVASMIEAKLSNAEAKGFMATQQYYATLYDVELAKKAELENKLVELNNALNETDFKTDTEAWSELANNIEEVEISIQESTNAMQEFKNEMRQIDWDLFDFARDQESKFMNEAEFMIDLLDSAKMFSEAGEITAEGMATMGLHAANYNAYLEQSISYAEELAKRQAEIEAGSTDRAVIDRYNELLELQQESILSAESEKDAMIDLVSEGIELQKEAFQGLIDEYTEALDIQKDLYDYQKKNSEQTKKIANIQKQLAAYQGDQSEEARAKVQQLQIQLEEEKGNLESDQYDRYIADQKEILNTIYEDYETTLDMYLDNATKVISDSINMANKNATTIGKTLTKATNEVGYDVKNVWIDERGLLSVNFSGIKSNIQAGTDVLHDIKESNDRLIAAQKSAISESLGDLSSADGVLNQTLTSIRDIVSEINGKLSGEGGGSSSSSGTEGGGGNTPSGNNEKVPNGNGGNFTAGATLKKVTGTWYAASDGTGNSGSVTTAGATSWKIDKINEGSKYPYHIIGYKNGKFAGSGWVKKSQISAYKTGARRIDEDQNAWTQENGTEYIIRPSDGAILTPLYKGDSVLNAEATKNLWNMANNPMQFMKDNMSVSIPNVSALGNKGNVENNVQLSITLPNVTNYQEFVSRLQSDKKFEKMIVDVTSSALTGSNSLSKYRHKF